MVSVVRLEKILKRKGALDRSANALYWLPVPSYRSLPLNSF